MGTASDDPIYPFCELHVSAPVGTPFKRAGAKTQGLIAFLALDTEQARQSLRQAIPKLRRLFEAEDTDGSTVENDRVGLNPDTVIVDTNELARLVRDLSPDKAVETVSLAEPPLPESLFGQQPLFADWLASERQRVPTQAGKIFERAAKEQVKKGRVADAIATVRRLITLNPLRDGSQMVLIRITAQYGERAAAVQQFDTYDDTLNREPGVGATEIDKLMLSVFGTRWTWWPFRTLRGPKAARSCRQ